MGSNGSEEYKPYTTPYTGAGAVKTEQGWVSSRDSGAPGAASGPGERRDSGPPVPSFHHVELTATGVPPPPGHETPDSTTSRSRRQSASTASHPLRSTPINADDEEIKEIKGPNGVGYDLPTHHDDLSKISNRDIALKISLLNIKKGNVHEAMHQAATNRDILSREPHEQFKFRDENARKLREVEEAIRAWERVQADRAGNITNPGLVDMLMISQDYHKKAEPADQQQKQQPAADNTPSASNSNSNSKSDSAPEGEKEEHQSGTGSGVASQA